MLDENRLLINIYNIRTFDLELFYSVKDEFNFFKSSFLTHSCFLSMIGQNEQRKYLNKIFLIHFGLN